MEGLTIPTFPLLHKKIRGTLPSGQMWEAYRTLFDVNSTLQRLIVLRAGCAEGRLRRAAGSDRRHQQR
jgi:hypothetical protein